MGRPERRQAKQTLKSLGKGHPFTKQDVCEFLEALPDQRAVYLWKQVEAQYKIHTDVLAPSEANAVAAIEGLALLAAKSAYDEEEVSDGAAICVASTLGYFMGLAYQGAQKAAYYAHATANHDMSFEEYKANTRLTELWTKPWSEVKPFFEFFLGIDFPELAVKRVSKEDQELALRIHYDEYTEEQLKAEFTSMPLDISGVFPYLLAEIRNLQRKRAERQPTKKQSDHIAYLQRSLEKCTADKEERIQAVQDACRKQLDDAASEIERLKKQLSLCQQERDTALSKVKQLEEEISAEEEASVTSEEQLLPLPEVGITIVGGHNNMITALRKEFPGWRYVDAQKAKAFTVGCPEMVFIYTNYCGHDAQENVLSQVDGSIVRRVGGDRVTNIPQLIHYMQYLYTKSKE